MEEKIKELFDEKMVYLNEFSEKNTANMRMLKDELHAITINLKSIALKMELEDLKNYFMKTKSKKQTMLKEICNLKRDIRTLNNLCDEIPDSDFKMTIKDLFSPSNCPDYQIFKSYFKVICQTARNIQQALEETNCYE